MSVGRTIGELESGFPKTRVVWVPHSGGTPVFGGQKGPRYRNFRGPKMARGEAGFEIKTGGGWEKGGSQGAKIGQGVGLPRREL